MICFDTPRLWDRRRLSAHLYSDLAGTAGSAELLAFAADVDLAPRWLQERGTCREHFDIWAGKIDAAREAGAELVDHRTMARHMQAKDEATRGFKLL